MATDIAARRAHAPLVSALRFVWSSRPPPAVLRVIPSQVGTDYYECGNWYFSYGYYTTNGNVPGTLGFSIVIGGDTGLRGLRTHWLRRAAFRLPRERRRTAMSSAHLLVLAGALTRHNGHYGNGVTPNNCYSGSGRSTPYLAAEGAFGAASQGRFNSFVYQSKGGQDAIGLQSVAFPSASLGVAVGLQWGKSSQAACDDDYCEKVDSMIPNILTTADGGKTWQARRGTTNPANRGSAVAHESISSLLLPETSVCGPVTPLFSPLRDVGCAICRVWAYSHRL